MSLRVHIDDSDVFKDADWNILSPFHFNKNCEVLCVGLSNTIDDEYMKQYPDAKYILSPTTGIDHIKVDKNKYKIINLIPDRVQYIRASSEFCLLMILSVLRKMSVNLNGGKAVGEDLYHKTVGILGYGRIGKNVVNYVHNMGANVLIHDVKDIEHSVSKDHLLKNSDIVVVLVSAKPENKHFINFNDFDVMKKGAYLVNIARPFIVNDYALLQALQTNKISGAAVDFVENRTLFDEYLKYNDNLIITNHIAGSTIQSRKKACDFVFYELMEYLKISHEKIYI